MNTKYVFHFREFNNTGSCSRQVNNGSCTIRGTTLLHLCNFLLPSGLTCNQPHPRAGNH